MGVSRHTAEWVSSLRYEDLSDLAIERIEVAVLDYLGCAIAGAATETGMKLMDYVLEVGREGGSTVFGTKYRFSPPDAALLNGTFGHALDYDDVSFHMIGHPGVTILPAVLALAEEHDRSGADVMMAYAAGYEVATRIGYAMNVGGHYEKGWHATGTLGTMGATAGACRVLGLDAATTAQALGMAASMAAGLRQNFGRDTKLFMPDEQPRTASRQRCSPRAASPPSPTSWKRPSASSVSTVGRARTDPNGWSRFPALSSKSLRQAFKPRSIPAAHQRTPPSTPCFR